MRLKGAHHIGLERALRGGKPDHAVCATGIHHIALRASRRQDSSRDEQA